MIHNIEAISGDYFTKEIEFYNEDETAFDLSGYASAKMELKKYVTYPADLAFSTADNSIVIEGNKATFSKSSEEMNIPTGVYMFDLEFTDVQGEKVTLLSGTFTVKKDITD